jgi:uncharacterized protein YbjT (DUF2867 family)
MFVVAGVTGQTGAAVAQALLDRKKSVRVLVRKEERGAAWKAKGAEVAVINLDDSSALAGALEGAEGAYLLVPPAYASPAPLATACGIVDAYSVALKISPVKQAVVLSSIGAQHPQKTGPIIPCHYAEQELSKLRDTQCTFLRAAYFMENLASFMGVIKGQGVLPVLFSPARTIAMVAVQDIGRITADVLAEAGPTHQVIEVSGPTDQSFDDVAAMFAKALGSAVKAVQVPEASIVGALTGLGMPAPTAELYREMAMGVEAGLVAFERGKVRHLRGSVRIEDAVRRLAS